MEGLAELHTHLGGSVSSDILWSLAHRQGIALPVKDFWDFDRLVTVSDPRGVPDLDAPDAIYPWPCPDDRSDGHAAPERDHRREGDSLGAARRRGNRHRGAAARRRALRLLTGSADGGGRPGRGPRRDDPRRRGGRRDGPRRDRR